MHSEQSNPDLRLPDHRQEIGRLPAPVRVMGAAGGAAGVGIVTVVYLIAAPFIAVGTGVAQIAMEIRENAVRPRPFVGKRHGLPFLDPPATAPAAQVITDEAEA